MSDAIDGPPDAAGDPAPEPTGMHKQYAAGNTREDGSYRVGKSRPPEHSRFREGDGRERGRRSKGIKNFDTYFELEGRRLITVREGDMKRRVPKIQGTIIRTYDNALTKGDPRSASLVFSHAARMADKQSSSGRQVSPVDDAELDAWLQERQAILESSEPDPGEQPDENRASTAPPEANDER